MTNSGERNIRLADAATVKKILGIARPGGAGDALIAFAVGLAKQLGFTPDFVLSYDEPPVSIADSYAIGSAADADILKRQ